MIAAVLLLGLAAALGTISVAAFVEVYRNRTGPRRKG